MKRILVFGDIIKDVYIEGTARRLSPEAPVPVLEEQRPYEYRLGGAANVALNLKAMGAMPILAGILGEEQGTPVKELLDLHGIDYKTMHCSNIPTPTKTRVVVNSQHVLRMDWESKAIPHEYIEYLFERLNASPSMADVDTVVISDYNKGAITRESLELFTKLWGFRNFKYFIDPRPANGKYYRLLEGTKVMTPNREEALAMVPEANGDIEIAGRRLAVEMGTAIVTAGAGGMFHFTGGRGQSTHYPTLAQEVCDVSGAGDTVIAALAAYTSFGYPLSRAIEFANTAAGIAVSRQKTVAVSHQEVLNFLSKGR